MKLDSIYNTLIAQPLRTIVGKNNSQEETREIEIRQAGLERVPGKSGPIEGTNFGDSVATKVIGGKTIGLLVETVDAVGVRSKEGLRPTPDQFDKLEAMYRNRADLKTRVPDVDEWIFIDIPKLKGPKPAP